MKRIILACDLGTGGCKASLYSSQGQCLASSFRAYKTSYPLLGWREQKPNEWWDVVVASTRQLLKDFPVSPEDVACIGVSGHSPGSVLLDATGALLRESVPIWSDRRAVPQAKKFFEKNDELQWYRKTGSGFPAAHYPLFKLQWFKDREPEMFQKIRYVLGTKDYINYRLTGVIATDPSFASGMGFYNLLDAEYDEELLAASGLDSKIFPQIVPSTQILGTLTREAADLLGLPDTVPVVAGGSDSSCMAAGGRNIKPGRLYASLGPSSWIAVSDTKPLLDEKHRPYVFTHVVPGMYVSAIGMFASGTAFSWVRDNFCKDLVAAAAAKGVPVYDAMIHLATQSTIGANRLLFNPSLVGGSSLDPSVNIRGAFLGLDVAHTQADVIRATIEGITLNMRRILDALRTITDVGDRMDVVGGGSMNAVWRQIYADALRINIEKTNVVQSAAGMGVAVVAGVGTGIFSSFDEIDKIQTVVSVEKPIAENAAKYDQLSIVFNKATEFLSGLGDFWASTDEEYLSSQVAFDE